MRKKRVPQETKVHKEGSLYQGGLPELTPTEATIYSLWAEDFLTPLQIALRRGKSITGIYRHIRSIKRKGYVLNMVHRVQNSDPTCEPSVSCGDSGKGASPRIRLHGQHFVVRLLSKRPVYDELRRRNNVQYLQDCTVKLHRESIEVYASSGLSFFGDSAEKATAKSLTFWTRVFHRLESHLGVVVVKARAQNIRQVSAHYARMNCGIARDAIDAGDRVRLFAREDGRLWFTIDNSFNLEESETLHPETAEQDMGLIERQVGDWRAHPELLTMSEMQRTVQMLVQSQGEAMQALQALAVSQQTLSETLGALLRPPEARPGPPGERPFYTG